MREIKFRAWDNVLKEMTTGFGRPHLVIRLSGRVTEGATCPDMVLMQYTGLKDRNGIDIYEGDILKSTDMYGEYVGNIEWWNDRWTLACTGKNDGTMQNQSLMTVKLPEIIGNIYDNKIGDF